MSAFIRVQLSIGMTAASLFWPSWCVAQQSQSETHFDVVFDLDWTIVNPTTEAMAKADPRGIIKIKNEIYRLSDHAIDVLIALHKTPGFRVSFFSGGQPERNNSLIRNIYELIEKKSGDSTLRPHLVLNLEHMERVSSDRALKFSDRNKKNLEKFFDLKNVLLIDDVHDFVPSSQEKNILYLGKTYNDRIRYELKDLENPKHVEYSAPSFSEWVRDREKLVRILGILLEAQEQAQKLRISYVDAAQEVLKLEAKGQFQPATKALREKRVGSQILFDPLSCSAKFR